MPLTAVEAPRDVLVTNQWVLEVDGVQRATFVAISGIGRSIETVARGDGGTGIIYTFSNQLVNYGTLQLTRMVDPADGNDLSIDSFMNSVIATGKKLNGELVKYHFGKPLFRIQFTGMLFTQESHPALSKQASGPYEMGYIAKVDFWEKIFPA